MSYVEIDYNDLIPVDGGFKTLKECSAREVFAHADQLRYEGNYWRKVAFVLQNEAKRRATETVKSRETRLRRAAARQDMMLRKSRRRDINAYNYGTYALVDVYTNALVAGDVNSGYGLSLDEVETALSE